MKPALGVLIAVLTLSLAAGVYVGGRTAGWWGTSPALRALMSEPILANTVAGYSRLHLECSESGVGEKNRPQSCRAWYSVGSHSPADVQSALEAEALNAGYEREATRGVAGIPLFSSQRDGRAVVLAIARGEDSAVPAPDGVDPARAIVVSLSYQ